MHKISVTLSAACLAMPFVSVAQTGAEPKPISHEALWMMKRVGAPAASPDGKWVVYSVREQRLLTRGRMAPVHEFRRHLERIKRVSRVEIRETELCCVDAMHDHGSPNAGDV
jgi:hypothetical protein